MSKRKENPMSALIWTRSLEHWPKDKVLFRDYNVKVLRLACVQHKRLSLQGAIELIPNKTPIFIFTSTYAVRSFFECDECRPLQVLMKSNTVLAVGPATAAELQMRGVQAQVPFGVKNGKGLGEFIKKSWQAKDVQLILPGAKRRAFDLALWLEPQSYQCITLNLYETDSICLDSRGQTLTLEARKAWLGRLRGVICFASPSAALGFVNTFKELSDHKDFPSPQQLKVALIGTTSGRAYDFEALNEVHVATEPSLAALVAKAVETLPP